MNIDKQVEQMKPKRFTTSQAAALVGKSTDTLKRWRTRGTVVPSDAASFGKITVPLYTLKDVRALEKTAKTLRPGRKPNKEEA